MKINLIRSDEIYKKMMNSPAEKRDDIYRWEMMKPFEHKWACINVPMKAKKQGGYDVVMASTMLGLLPPVEVDKKIEDSISRISDDTLWNKSYDVIKKSLDLFSKAGFELPVKEYNFSIMLANPESPYVKLSDGYSGDGGIPGYILLSLVPDDATIKKLPFALAHECNHNVRFQFEKWSQKITLQEMMITEGLAENFTAYMFGEESIGPWVKKTELYMLNEYIKPLIKESLDITGFENITPFLYGDEIAMEQGYIPVGLPYCAGYACGYYMVKYYLEKSGKNIVEATLTPSKEIIREIDGFWDEENK